MIWRLAGHDNSALLVEIGGELAGIFLCVPFLSLARSGIVREFCM